MSWRRKMNPPHRLDTSSATQADKDRFLAMVIEDPQTGCWEWQGHKDEAGYGQFWWRTRAHWAHRWARATFAAPVRRGDDVDHDDCCRNPSCVNPRHTSTRTHEAHGRRHGPEGAEARKQYQAIPF